jgi:hypothetical protein
MLDNPPDCLRAALVERAGFEPAYGKPGQIYSMQLIRGNPPFSLDHVSYMYRPMVRAHGNNAASAPAARAASFFASLIK